MTYNLNYPNNLVPISDDRWQKENNIQKAHIANKDFIWKWFDDKGRLAFITYRINTSDGSKKIFPLTYTLEEDKSIKINRSWSGWDTDLPLYNLPKILGEDKTILITEGEKTVVAAEKIYPNFVSTTFAKGVGRWYAADYTPLKNRTIYLWPDNDNVGFRNFLKLANHLKNKMNCRVLMVKVPETFPGKWDLADELPKGFDGDHEALIALAKDAVLPANFQHLDQAIADDRFIIIEDSNGKQFYDRETREVRHKDLLNLLYKADPNLKGLATNAIAASTPPRVKSTAFKRINDPIVRIGDHEFLNTYEPVKFDPLTESELEEHPERILSWKNHIHMICNESLKLGNYFHATLAHDLQFPNRNRTWAWLLQSTQGVGKGIIFNVIKMLNGPRNVAHVTNDMLVDRYRQYLSTTDMIVCTETRIIGRDASSKLDKLKELISEDVHPIEEKFVNTRYHHGHFKIYLSSNDKVPVRIEETDRRISFIETLKTKKEILQEDPDYFKKLWAWINNFTNIKHLYHHYKNDFIIPEEFNANEPIETQSKKALIEFGRDQIFNDLDAKFKKQHNPFDADIVNIRDCLEAIRESENAAASGQGVSYERVFKNLTESRLKEFFGMINAKPVNNGKNLIQLEGKRKKRWWIIRNHDYWSQITDNTLFRLHVNSPSKFSAPIDLEKFKLEKEATNDKEVF
jgi:hypothetical protein